MSPLDIESVLNDAREKRRKLPPGCVSSFLVVFLAFFFKRSKDPELLPPEEKDLFQSSSSHSLKGEDLMGAVHS